MDSLSKKNIAAFILAAGYGSRMGPYTSDTPKPLLKIGNAPMLGFSLFLLKQWGIKDVYLNTFYRKEKMEEFLYHPKWNSAFNLNLIQEPELLGTAGGLRNAYSLLKSYDYIILLNSDMILFPNKNSTPASILNEGYLKPEAAPFFFLRTKGTDTTQDGKERSFHFCIDKRNISLIPGGSYIYMGYSILTKNFLHSIAQSEEKELGPYLEKLPECFLLGREYGGILHSVGNKKEYETIFGITDPSSIIPKYYQKDWHHFVDQYILPV